ncbi:MAG TPA: alpha/beta hydrolase [Candidatus Binataceae bacterium]|nr:alpha/beta hydrolase [Candidatus Binataceae bacterium]
MEPRVLVLVHGAWHGGWCWRRVADRLTSAGHRVFTPTLTGLADRSHLASERVNLSTHVTDIVNLIRWEGLSDIVLCGHSYGGMVITGVADRAPGQIASLVYLDAYVPENGQSLVDIRPLDLPTALALPPFPADYFNVNEKDRAWVDRQCTAHPIACATERLGLTGAYRGVRRRIFIRAINYPSPHFEAAYQRAKANPAWVTHEVACGHEVMLDMPELLAELLEAAC